MLTVDFHHAHCRPWAANAWISVSLCNYVHTTVYYMISVQHEVWCKYVQVELQSSYCSMCQADTFRFPSSTNCEIRDLLSGENFITTYVNIKCCAITNKGFSIPKVSNSLSFNQPNTKIISTVILILQLYWALFSPNLQLSSIFISLL